MFKANVVLTAAIVAASSVALGLPSAESWAREPFVVEDVKTVSVTVESVDVNNRSMFVRDRDGRSVIINVPREVRDLTQVKAGDRLLMHYVESVALVITPKRARGNPSKIDPGETDRRTNLLRAAPEVKSAVVSSYQKVTSAVIQSVDKGTHSIAFKDENGFSRNMTVKNPEVQEIVDTLKEGDQVQMTYTEATAVSIESEK